MPYRAISEMERRDELVAEQAKAHEERRRVRREVDELQDRGGDDARIAAMIAEERTLDDRLAALAQAIRALDERYPERAAQLRRETSPRGDAMRALDEQIAEGQQALAAIDAALAVYDRTNASAEALRNALETLAYAEHAGSRLARGVAFLTLDFDRAGELDGARDQVRAAQVTMGAELVPLVAALKQLAQACPSEAVAWQRLARSGAADPTELLAELDAVAAALQSGRARRLANRDALSSQQRALVEDAPAATR